jgi:hypothetical protein
MSHNYFVVPGVVDGAVVSKQAWKRLTDKWTGGEDSYVHKHTYREACNDRCTIYHVCETTNLPASHPIEQPCPVPEPEGVVVV